MTRLLAAVSLVGVAFAQDTPSPTRLSDRERAGLRDTLYIANLSWQDLEFARRPFSIPGGMPLIDQAIDKPIEAADTLMALHASAGTLGVTGLLEALRRTAFGDDEKPLPAMGIGIPALPAQVPADIAPHVTLLVQAVATANAHVKAAIERLSAEERRRVIEELPLMAVEEDRIKFSFSPATRFDRKGLMDLLARVDLARIRAAAARLSAQIDEGWAGLRRVNSQWRGSLKFRSEGILVVLKGIDNDFHADSDAALTIDLGGDDVYRGRHGAAAGYVGVLLDLAGNDRYEVNDLNVGAAILGIGYARDGGGLDIWRGRSLCFGAGLAGVGVLVKEGGHDIYRSTALAQGFGQFGIGMLLDTNGNDDYDLKLLGQGAARTQGVGWLIDRRGNDVYRAGGLILNSPLFKDVHYSQAQGCGMGYREDTGGIYGGAGLLTDLEGDDVYIGETYCQAASYWYALGSLYDAAGHDTYTAYHYAQSSAMHICAAYLFDLGGDDAFITKFGASHAIGHDYGVAFFLSREGNDVYAARDSTPGVGNANGLGIFLDAAGDDRYQGPPGVGNPARGSGSLGVFADLGGQNRFGSDIADGEAKVRDSWGVAFAMPGERTSIPIAGDEPPAETWPRTGSKPRGTNAELEGLYRRATQWNVGTAQSEVRQSLSDLIGMGLPAFQWMVENKLGGADRLQHRAFVTMVEQIGEPARRLLVSRLTSDSEAEVRSALAICRDAKIEEAVPMLMGPLRRPALRRLAIQAAGELRARTLVGELLPLTLDEDGLVAANAMTALMQIGDEDAYSTAEALAVSNDLMVRKAALRLLAQFPNRSLATARRMIEEPDERVARIGVELGGMLGTPEMLDEIGERLQDPRAGVRIAALVALDGRCPPKHRAQVGALRNDPIPTVRAVAAKVDPGR